MSSRLLREKIRVRAILKESTASYISLENLINVDFRKKYELPVFFLILQKKIAKMTAKMTMRHSGKQMNQKCTKIRQSYVKFGLNVP